MTPDQIQNKLNEAVMNIQTLQDELSKLVQLKPDHYIPQPGEVVDYTHLLPAGYEFCTEEEAEKWVKVEMLDCEGENELGCIVELSKFGSRNFYRPIRPIQYHVAVHEAVTVTDEPIKVAEYYQPLFDLLHKEHNVIATQSELDEIIRTAGSLGKLQHKCKYCGVMTSQPDDQCYKNPYAVDWSNAPEWADVHCFDKSGTGYWYGREFGISRWNSNHQESKHTLPTGLDWKQSKTTRP